MTNSEILMICLTAVIAAAGVIGACIFNSQLSVMQGQLDEMKSTGKQNEILIETNKTLANAATQTAEATQSASATARQALEISEGASLSVDTWAISNWGAKPIVEFKIFNSGRNAGDLLEIICKFYVGPALPAIPDYSNPFRSPPAIVAANSRVRIIVDQIPITPAQLVEIEAGRTFLFLYGKITYKNIVFDTAFEVGYSQKLTILRDAQGQLSIRFDFPDASGYSFIRPKPRN